ncbi:DUF7710 domain-containing protein [Mucilaginibacter myungsuensis]|uniref:DUF7710 domain-containing protein n=1 Tax=Mucilaginibacter myungsuensis TaxID=649104 RepID=A0A929KXV2_9SPHI|nr:hypothetical protein [Mucilaginibacter myungsuensis]MBE9660899.1 hypothetical protein [Mucilaginibacter myungsuensis]MDN3600945.1 hypothetical protein [Mucilaginibacter myungsuensis]
MNEINSIWIFHGTGARFSSGVFTSLNVAEKWIMANKLTGLLTKYPINEGVYDWAIKNDFFEIKKDSEKEPFFIQAFTSGSQEHYHYENGELEQ